MRVGFTSSGNTGEIQTYFRKPDGTSKNQSGDSDWRSEAGRRNLGNWSADAGTEKGSELSTALVLGVFVIAIFDRRSGFWLQGFVLAPMSLYEKNVQQGEKFLKKGLHGITWERSTSLYRRSFSHRSCLGNCMKP